MDQGLKSNTFGLVCVAKLCNVFDIFDYLRRSFTGSQLDLYLFINAANASEETGNVTVLVCEYV